MYKNNRFPPSRHSFLFIISLSALFLSVHANAVPGYTFSLLAAPEGFWVGDMLAINNNGKAVGDARGPITWNTTAGTYNTYLSVDGSFADINDAGQIAGVTVERYNGEIVTRAALWDNGVKTNLSAWGGAVSINNSGQAVGSVSVNSTQWAVRWDGTKEVRLDDLYSATGPQNNAYSVAIAINDSGQVLGHSSGHNVLWNGTVVTDLGTISDGRYLALNNSAEFVGYGNFGTAQRPMLWKGTDSIILDSLGGQGSAVRINNQGQVIGYSFNYSSSGSYRNAVLWNGSDAFKLDEFIDKNSQFGGWEVSHVADINDHGLIVGSAYNRLTGKMAPFLLTPDNSFIARAATGTYMTGPAVVPVPAAAWLLASGLLGLAGVARKRHQTGNDSKS